MALKKTDKSVNSLGSINWKRNLLVLQDGSIPDLCKLYDGCSFLPLICRRKWGFLPSLSIFGRVRFFCNFFYHSTMAPYWGAMADRVGQKKMAIRAGFGLAICYWLSSMAQTPHPVYGSKGFDWFHQRFCARVDKGEFFHATGKTWLGYGVDAGGCG